MEAKLAEGGSVIGPGGCSRRRQAGAHGQYDVCLRGSSAGVCWCPRTGHPGRSRVQEGRLLAECYREDSGEFEVRLGGQDFEGSGPSAASARRSQTAVVEQAHTQNGGRCRGRRHAKPSNCDPQVARVGQSWDHPQEDHRGLHVRAAGRCGVRGEVDSGCEVPHHRRDYRRAGWQSWGGDRGKAFPKGNQVALASCDRGGGRPFGGRPGQASSGVAREWCAHRCGLRRGDCRDLPKRRAQGRFVRGHPQVLGTGRASCELRQCGGARKSWSGQRSADSARGALSPCTRRGQMSSSGSEMLSCQKWQLL